VCVCVREREREGEELWGSGGLGEWGGGDCVRSRNLNNKDGEARVELMQHRKEYSSTLREDERLSSSWRLTQSCYVIIFQ